MDLLLQPVPHDQAAAFIRSKPVMAREAFDRLLPDLKARAFVVTGVESANVVQAVRDRIADLPQGADWDSVKKDIATQLSPWLEDGEGGAGAAGRRAELLLRVHGGQAYAAAQHEVMERQRAAFPYWQYVTMEDDRVRDSHAALDGLVLPADSPFWHTHFPPWDWGCRCQAVPIQEDDAAQIQEDDAGRPPEAQRVVSGARLTQLETSHRLITAGPGNLPQFISVSPPQTYTFKPGTLKMNTADLRGRYDTATWSNFETWAKAQPLGGGQTVWDWLNGKAESPELRVERTKPTAVPPPLAAIPPSKAKPAAAAPEEVPHLNLAASTIENDREAIRTATYKSKKDLGGGVNATHVLENGRKVVFKPAAGEHESELRRGVKPGTQYQREVAASILDEELGIGLVPPTALLTHEGEVGSAQLFMEGYRPAFALRNPFKAVADLPERVRQDWQLFDELAGHLDRHMGNYMLKVRRGKVDLALIDNGLSFSTVAQRPLGDQPLAGAAIDATNLARLRDLLARRDQITEKLKPYLEPRAIELLFQRAERLLQKGTYAK